MIRVTRHLLPAPAAALLPLLLLSGCPKKDSAAPPGPGQTATGGARGGGPAAAPVQAGMADPFARLSAPAAKSLERGYKALKQKKYEDAAAAFGEVVAAAPDNTSARYQLARALLLSGKAADAERQLEELLARDFLAYDGRADKAREWKPLRDAPEWAAYQAARERARAAYAQGLDRGFVFVARQRLAKEPTGSGDVKLELNQEVYHYDPATARYRRLTYTDGKVFAAMRAPDGKALAFLTADRLRRGGDGDLFLDPGAGYVDLGTLESVGPFKLAGTFHEVSIGFGPGGAVWATESTPGVDGGTFVVDTARTGLAKAGAAVIQGERTWAQAAQVWHSGKGSPAGVTMAADHRSFTVGEGGAVTSARELADSSLDWSPGHKRITYAGKLDACKVLSGDHSKNELFVYDVDKKSAQRIDSGISEFETLWLDDNLLVYENGIGAKGTLNTYDLAAHKKTQLAPRHGAGLYGVPSLNCQKEQPEAEPAEAGEEECTDCGGE